MVEILFILLIISGLAVVLYSLWAGIKGTFMLLFMFSGKRKEEEEEDKAG